MPGFLFKHWIGYELENPDNHGAFLPILEERMVAGTLKSDEHALKNSPPTM
jgi:hypothetical protein